MGSSVENRQRALSQGDLTTDSTYLESPGRQVSIVGVPKSDQPGACLQGLVLTGNRCRKDQPGQQVCANCTGEVLSKQCKECQQEKEACSDDTDLKTR